MLQTSTFDVIFKNPCIDPEFVSISKVALPTGLAYALASTPNEGGYSFVHSPFELSVSHSLCGSIAYSATFNSSPIDTSSSLMKYESGTRKFTIYSEDIADLGTHQITVSAYLTDYPSVTSEEPDESSTIDIAEIVGPCASTTITAP